MINELDKYFMGVTNLFKTNGIDALADTVDECCNHIFESTIPMLNDQNAVDHDMHKIILDKIHGNLYRLKNDHLH